MLFVPLLETAFHAVLGVLVGAALGYTVGAFIDKFVLAEVVSEQYPDAFKLMIKKKKKNAVNVGIFDEYDETIEANVQFQTEQGVSDSLYVGQEIYL